MFGFFDLHSLELSVAHRSAACQPSRREVMRPRPPRSTLDRRPEGASCARDPAGGSGYAAHRNLQLGGDRRVLRSVERMSRLSTTQCRDGSCETVLRSTACDTAEKHYLLRPASREPG